MGAVTAGCTGPARATTASMRGVAARKEAGFGLFRLMGVASVALACTAGCAAADGASEEETSSASAAQGAVTLPIHGVDTWWSYPNANYITRVDQRVRIDDEAPHRFW